MLYCMDMCLGECMGMGVFVTVFVFLDLIIIINNHKTVSKMSRLSKKSLEKRNCR